MADSQDTTPTPAKPDAANIFRLVRWQDIVAEMSDDISSLDTVANLMVHTMNPAQEPVLAAREVSLLQAATFVSAIAERIRFAHDGLVDACIRRWRSGGGGAMSDQAATTNPPKVSSALQDYPDLKAIRSSNFLEDAQRLRALIVTLEVVLHARVEDGVDVSTIIGMLAEWALDNEQRWEAFGLLVNETGVAA